MQYYLELQILNIQKYIKIIGQFMIGVLSNKRKLLFSYIYV